MALLLFEVHSPAVHSPQVGQKPMDKRTQDALFGRSFEQLGQEHRVSVLRGLGLIDEEMQGWFSVVRSKRQACLHYYSADEQRSAHDAVETYKSTVSLVVKGLGLDARTDASF